MTRNLPARVNAALRGPRVFVGRYPQNSMGALMKVRSRLVAGLAVAAVTLVGTISPPTTGPAPASPGPAPTGPAPTTITLITGDRLAVLGGIR
jgi:hypothetical protein